MGWREVWNQRNVELCPPSQKMSHCTGQEENSRYLQSVFHTDTNTQKPTCCISLHYDLTQLWAGVELTQHIHMNRYSPKSLKLFSEVSRRNISLCSYAHRAPLLAPFWRASYLVTISSTGKKPLRLQKTDTSSYIAHWYSFLWPKTLGFSLQHQLTYPAVEFFQGLLPGCWVHAWQQFTCEGYTSSKANPAQKQMKPDSLQAKFHLLVFHHQVTDVSDRQVPKQLDVVPSDLVKQLGICISARQNQASKASMDHWSS